MTTSQLIEPHRDVDELRRAARTIRAQTLADRLATCDALGATVRSHLELEPSLDEPGLEAIAVWTAALEHADVSDVDLLQELLYGLDALVRVHLWRETGPPLEAPVARLLGYPNRR
jgi:hypothetical protein